MNEDLLHTLWKHSLFATHDLRTTQGEPIKIIRVGDHNFNAGPDFLNAQMLMGEVRWAGSVEIHWKTSHWDLHGHSEDTAYENVILHVVYEHDSDIHNHIPVLALKDYIADATLDRYKKLKPNNKTIPCQDQINLIEPFHISAWLERMTIEKLEQKVILIEEKFRASKGNWREVFYQYLGRNFGFKVNADAFERLTETLPQNILAKHRKNLLQLEALLYGQAGMLETDFIDIYPNVLKNEWSFLRKKYQLSPIGINRWKFLRMRPDNFPSIRISQFAKLSHHSDHLFSRVLDTDSVKTLESLFQSEASPYWDSHYTFEHESKKSVPKRMGSASVQILLINTVIPMLYAYGMLRGDQKFKDKALDFLMQIKPEHNSITALMGGVGFTKKNAFDSQGLLHLKKEYCDKKRCLNCGIGIKILQSPNVNLKIAE